MTESNYSSTISYMNQIADDASMIKPVFKEMSQYLKLDVTKDLKFRETALTNLINGYEKMKPEIEEALKQDLGYNSFMSNFAAHSVTLGEINDLLTGLRTWSKTEFVENPIGVGISKSSIQYEPLGLVLVMSAWNYPIYTALPQAAAAIAAGNSVIIKPSELAPYTSHVIRRLFQVHMDPRFYRVIEGKVEIARTISQMPFDMICFTGSTLTGRLVAIQAAKNLTPCLLELGGKCPVIIDETADLDSAVLRVIFGKYLNCGQTCVGVDHVYVHENIKDDFTKRLLAKMEEAYGGKQNLVDQGNYGKIINTHHLERLESYLNQNHGGKVLYGGLINREKLFISPTVVDSPRNGSAMMTEQIFGPILPLLSYTDLNSVIAEIRDRPKPLVVYLFSENSKNLELVKTKTSSGAFVVNDAVVQLLNSHLPFGGVGPSGYGRYHGKYGFINFSNMKSVCETKAFNVYPLSTRFPPYTEHKKKMMNFLLRFGGITSSQLGRGFIVSVLVAAGLVGFLKIRPHL